MKQATALLAGIPLIILTMPVNAGDLPAYPLPTGMTAMSPTVTPPVLHEGMPVDGTGRRGWKERFGSFSLFGKSGAIDCEPHYPVRVKPQWCTDCAPAFRNPLPPLPPPSIVPVARVERVKHHEPDCDRGSCWEKCKAWLCFRQTPVHLPCTPTPRNPPLFTLFPCKEHGGVVGAGCDISRPGLRHMGRAIGGCATCPTPGEALVPGYRLALPQGGMPPAMSPPVSTSHYRPGAANGSR